MSAKRNEDMIVDEDAEIGMLAEMGFSFQQSKDALEANNGGVDGAINTLLSGQHDSAEALQPAAVSSTVSVALLNPRPAPPPFSSRAKRVPSRRPQVPGAVAVEGPNPSSGNDDYTITNQSHSRSTINQLALSSNPSEPVTVEARLVDRNEEDMEELLQQRNEELEERDRELERLRRERENVVVAEVLATPPDDEENPPAATDDLEEEQEDLLEENVSTTTGIKRQKLLLGGCTAFALIGTCFVVLGLLGLFIFPPFTILTLTIPGIVFLIVSCIFCCCLCSRPDQQAASLDSQVVIDLHTIK